MRLDAQLARNVTSGVTNKDSWEKLFDAKSKLGSDVSGALERLVGLGEKAWAKYYNPKTNEVIYVCESGGEIYIWTRDIGTAGEQPTHGHRPTHPSSSFFGKLPDEPEHIIQIGYYSQDADLLVGTEWSLFGTFSANDVQKTSAAYKSWFTKYVKDGTGDVRRTADQVLRDALASAGVITDKGRLTVNYGGNMSATGAQ